MIFLVEDRARERLPDELESSDNFVAIFGLHVQALHEGRHVGVFDRVFGLHTCR